MSRYTDGTWTTAQQDGPTVIMIDPDTRSLIYEHRMMQTAEDWAPLALSTLNSSNALLVHETDPQALDCGIVSWTRTYANVPSSRDEYGEYVHAAQYNVAGELMELSIKTTARFHYDYFSTSNPSTIDIIRAPRAGVSGSVFYILYPPFPTDGEERAAEDSKLTRWKWHANIWERLTIYVVQPTLSELVT